MQEHFISKTKRAITKVAAISTGIAMMGATLTGALAQDLNEYPAPFVSSGTYDTSNVLVVGSRAAASDTLGMVDIATNLQFESKVCSSSGGTVNVVGGISEDIPIGAGIAEDGNTVNFDQEISDSDLPHLLDTAITFQSTDYDVKELLVLAQGTLGSVNVSSSLTSSEDDYETDVVLEVSRDAIKYYYVFDEAIIINATTSADPLEIKMLGKSIKITSVDSATKITARVGAEFFMNVGDTVNVDGKKISLNNVGSGGAIVINVDGVIETIPSSSTETVNGIEVNNDETFYEDNKEQRSATLIIGKDAVETYNDGDEFIGEDEDDPDWVWNLGNLHGAISTTTSNTAEFSGPIVGIENDFVWNDDSDNPPTVGECIDLPNNYISICFDSLTVAEDDYMTLTMELESSTDLSEAFSTNTSVASVFISVDETEGLVVDISQLGNANISSDAKTNKVWLYPDNSSLGLYYEDNNGKTQLAGYVSDGTDSNSDPYNGSTGFLDVNFKSTKNTDVQFDLVTAELTNFNLTIVPFESTELPSYQDNITTAWKAGATSGIASLGATASTEEATEVTWEEGAINTANSYTNLGTKDEDHRSKYGIIIRDPKSNGASDQVVLEIPGDQLQANIVIKGQSAISSAGGESCTVADVTPVSMLDTELTSPTTHNLILVGGPCANPLAESLDFGVSCSGWDLKEGEAIIKIVDNGNKVAMLVAGTEALDTRRAAKVVANWNDYTLAGTEALVKGTTLTDITVE
tara:strand:- start:22663 stop:24909 length:2247 start_codon:yes stop_codon:yes gene_type:complete